jgi:starch synthase
LKVLFVTSEALPFITTGGMGEVTGALPKALRRRGIATAVVLPLYEGISAAARQKLTYLTNFTVELAWRKQYCGVFHAEIDGVDYYLLDNEQYFKRTGIYGHYDDGERFAFFSKAALELLRHVAIKPDVIHCNDWQTALTPVYYRTHYCYIDGFQNIRFVYTIHNLKYQGKFGQTIREDVFGIGPEWTGLLEYAGCVNLMKAAIEAADMVTTVSPTYAREITHDYFGEGLAGLLRERTGKIRGILNGIDTADYNPANDPMIFAPFSGEDLSGKKQNKAGLQAMLGLRVADDIPLMAMVTRLVDHKGIDLVIRVLDEFMTESLQVVVVGTGDQEYENFFRAKQAAYPGRIHAAITFNPDLAHKVYAGADLFLMPSQTEPCGLSQMIALRYATLPIVRETGGLSDSIQGYNEITGKGNGFSFTNYNAHDMLYTIRRALMFYRQPQHWTRLMANAMNSDFSWDRSAGEYEGIYRSLTGLSQEETPAVPPETGTPEEAVPVPATTEPVKERPTPRKAQSTTEKASKEAAATDRNKTPKRAVQGSAKRTAKGAPQATPKGKASAKKQETTDAAGKKPARKTTKGTKPKTQATKMP